MDVELALASGQKQSDNKIINGFKTVEKRKCIFGYGFRRDRDDEHEKRAARVRPFTRQKNNRKEARKIAQKFAQDKNYNIKVSKSGKKTNRDVYSISMQDPDQKADIYMDITEKGGYPVYLIQNKKLKMKKSA